MMRRIVALAATKQGAIDSIKERLSELKAKGYAPKGSISVTRTETSNPGDNLWFKAEQPLVKI